MTLRIIHTVREGEIQSQSLHLVPLDKCTTKKQTKKKPPPTTKKTKIHKFKNSVEK